MKTKSKKNPFGVMMPSGLKSPKVSFEASLEILLSRPEKYVAQKHEYLRRACRRIMNIDIDGQNYLMVCGKHPGHKDAWHEDVDGGVYW